MRILPAILLAASLLASNDMMAQEKTKKAQTESTEDGEDLMAMLDDDNGKKKEYTTATFKATRVINGHSIENAGEGVLDFRVSHRFGPVNNGLKDFFGLDAANTNIGLDYGIKDWLMVGLNRSTYQKEVLGFTKIKLLRQVEGKGLPFSLSYMGAMSVQTLPIDTNMTKGRDYHFSSRMFFTNQLLIARKFNRWLSVQLMPTHIHYNLVNNASDPNDVIAMGIAGRVKLSNRMSLTGEYFYRINELPGYHNSLSVGLDIETGGHVFQLMFTNATATTERAFIGQSVDDWADGGIHFGFNISRVFTVKKPKGFESSRNKTW
jgi:hypothetical protein